MDLIVRTRILMIACAPINSFSPNLFDLLNHFRGQSSYSESNQRDTKSINSIQHIIPKLVVDIQYHGRLRKQTNINLFHREIMLTIFHFFPIGDHFVIHQFASMIQFMVKNTCIRMKSR